LFDLARSLDNPGEALRPAVSAASDQPDPIAVAFHAKAVAVQLYLMKPFRTGWNLSSAGGNAELKRFKHVPKIGAPEGTRESENGPGGGTEAANLLGEVYSTEGGLVSGEQTGIYCLPTLFSSAT
jgi:hypothetical protein